MRNALAAMLLTAMAVTFVHPALAQDSRDEGVKFMNARMAQMNQLTRAARLGTSANSDTFFIVSRLDGEHTGLDIQEAYVKEMNMPWPQCFEGGVPNSPDAAKCFISIIPTTFLIDKAGVVREIGHDTSKLQDSVKKLLEEKAP